jgi:hypothetical protein
VSPADGDLLRLNPRLKSYLLAQITMSLHGALLLLLLLVGGAATVNHHAGLTAGTALALLLLILTFLNAVIHAGALFMLYQACPNLDPLMADALGGGAEADYYIYGIGKKAGPGPMLEKAGFIDPADVRPVAYSAGRIQRRMRSAAAHGRAWRPQQASAPPPLPRRTPMHAADLAPPPTPRSPTDGRP